MFYEDVGINTFMGITSKLTEISEVLCNQSWANNDGLRNQQGF